MIVATLIASIEDAKVHCEWYKETFVRYETIRIKIKRFLEDRDYMKDEFELIKMKENLWIHFMMEKGVIFLIVYEENYPKKLGKACLLEVKEEFEKFIKTQYGSNLDVYSYVATINHSYSLLKFGRIKRQIYQENIEEF